MEPYHFDPNKKTEVNFYQENRDIFSQLENLGISINTVGYILKITDVKAWKYEKGVLKLPLQHRNKLEKLILKLEQSSRNSLR